MYDDDVLEIGTGAGLRAVSVESVLGVTRGTAGVYADLKVDRGPTEARRQVDAVGVAVVALAEDNAVEGLVEAEVDLHRVLLALDVERDDLGHVVAGRRPVLANAVAAVDQRGADRRVEDLVDAVLWP